MKTKKFVGTLLSIAIIVIGLMCPCFVSRVIDADDTPLVQYRTSTTMYNGTYVVANVASGRAFDNAGYSASNGQRVLAYPYHGYVNQQFTFIPVTRAGDDVLYMIQSNINRSYVLDMSGGVKSAGTKLQMYASNNTISQRFIIRDVYEYRTDHYEYTGVVIVPYLNTTLALRDNNSNSNITQEILPTDVTVAPSKFVWQLHQTLDKSMSYQANFSSEFDEAYPSFFNRSDQKEHNIEHYKRATDYIKIYNANGGIEAGATKYNSDGNPVYEGSVSFKLVQKYDPYAKFACGLFNWGSGTLNIANNTSNNINSTAIGGQVGNGVVAITYTSPTGQKHVDYNRNRLGKVGNGKVFNVPSGGVDANGESTYTSNNGVMTFTKVGDYSIDLYYTMYCTRDEYYNFFHRTFKFHITNPDCKLKAVPAIDDPDNNLSVAGYQLSVVSNQINVTYTGDDQDIKALDTDVVLNYIMGVSGKDDDTYNTKYQSLLHSIQSYCDYTVYFTGKPFYMTSDGNKDVSIVENLVLAGENVTETYTDKTVARDGTGVYVYQSYNKYNPNKLGYYSVYLALPPTLTTRVESYPALDEEGTAYNYCKAYAIVTYSNPPLNLPILSSTVTMGDEVKPYAVGSTISNTGDTIIKCTITITDIAGNVSTIKLAILPDYLPSNNQERMYKGSLQYNYNPEGYLVDLYDADDKCYHSNLFSTYDIAYRNWITNTYDNFVTVADDIYTLTLGDQVLTFEFNDQLIAYLNTLDVIKPYVINPALGLDIYVNEKSMHSDQIVLTPNFAFIQPDSMASFESKSIDFQYYSRGQLVKYGIINMDGKYHYGMTMLDILCDGDQSKWQEGYVRFTEYNVGLNSGSTYTAYIATDAPTLTILGMVNTSSSFTTLRDGNFYVFDKFRLSDVTSTLTSVVAVKFNDTTTYYTSHNINESKWFTANGDYEVTVCDLMGRTQTYYININSLADRVTGVDEFDIALGMVTFVTDSADVQIRIDGIVTEYDYQFDGSKYTYTFAPTSVERHIVICERGKLFGFRMAGVAVEEVVYE